MKPIILALALSGCVSAPLYDCQRDTLRTDRTCDSHEAKPAREAPHEPPHEPEHPEEPEKEQPK